MATNPDGWLTPDSDWIAKPIDRDARYILGIRAVGPPPHCECSDECRARREWHSMVDAVLDAWLDDREQTGAQR